MKKTNACKWVEQRFKDKKYSGKVCVIDDSIEVDGEPLLVYEFSDFWMFEKRLLDQLDPGNRFEFYICSFVKERI